jgi:hypothetical protein
MCFTKEARSQQTTGLFYTRSAKKGVYMMKFLLAIIIIRFLFRLLDNTPDEYEDEEENENDRIIHPAEFLIR